MKKTEKLLKLMGESTACKSCNQKIYFIKTKKGKHMPVEPDGTPHFANCPDADKFRKK